MLANGMTATVTPDADGTAPSALWAATSAQGDDTASSRQTAPIAFMHTRIEFPTYGQTIKLRKRAG